MKQYLYILSVLLFFAACEQSQHEESQISINDVSLYADYKMKSWISGDSISVFDGTSNILFTASEDGDTSKFVSESKLEESCSDLYVLYPYDMTAARTDYGLDIHFPSEQYVECEGLDSAACYAVDYTDEIQENTFLHLKEICGYFNFSVKAEYGIVKVHISGADDEYLAGSVYVSFSKGDPRIDVYDGISGVSLSSESVMDGTYQICVLPAVLQEGLKVTFYNSEGLQAEKRVVSVNDQGYESALVFVRGRANRIPIAFENPFPTIPENPEPENPEPENPEPENPEPENPKPETPTPENPTPETPGPETPEHENPQPEDPAPETPQPDVPEPEVPSDINTSTEDYIYQDIIDLWN